MRILAERDRGRIFWLSDNLDRLSESADQFSIDEGAFLSRNWKGFVCQDRQDLTMTKYELYLPLTYNNGTDIEPEKLEEIQQQLIAVFSEMTVSLMAAPLQGTWRYGGVEFVDDIIRIEIIAREDWESHQFFKNFKRRLKRKLRQIDVLITMQYIYTI